MSADNLGFDFDDAGPYALCTPEELLEQFRQGDREAFAALAGQCGGPLFGFLYHYLGDHGAAVAAYREAWAGVAKGAASFDPRERLRAWLFRLARDAALDAWAALPEAPALAAAADIAAAMRAGLDDDCTVEELGRRLARAVAALPLAQKDVFLLREDGDLSFAEISVILGNPIEAAQRQFAAALDALDAAAHADPRLTALLRRL